MGLLAAGLKVMKTGASIITGGAILGGAGGAAEVITRGKDSVVANWIRDLQSGIGGAGAEANPDIAKTGIFAWLKTIGEIIQVITNGKYGNSLVGLGNKGKEYDSDQDPISAASTDVSATADDDTPKGGAGLDRLTDSPNTDAALGIEDSDNSIVGAGTAVTAGLVAKGLGAKAIPGVASLYAAGEGLWDTGGYLLKGEFKKAGVRFASGAAETVLSAGGILTAAFGAAAREGIEEGAEWYIGKEVDMPDSDTLQLAKMGRDWALG